MTLITNQNQLAEALRFYGMGELADGVERTSVAGTVEKITETTVTVLVQRPVSKVQGLKGSDDIGHWTLDPQQAKRCDFLRSQVIVLHYDLHAAVVRIPRAFLPAFCLSKYELTGKLLETFERRVATNLALPPSRPAKLEKFGSVRI